MATDAGSVYVRVLADTRGFKMGMASAGRGLSSFAKLAVGGGIALGLKSIVNAAADFESQLNTMQAVAGATGSQMKAVSKLSKDLGRDISLPGTSAADAAKSMTELVKGGLSVEQAMKAAKGTLQLAAAAEIDNAEAATITARALNSFGLSGSEAGRVADILANAANKSTGEINDFALGLQQSSAVAKQAGLSINDTVAALMELSNAGVVGADAGTSLKTMLMRLQPQTAKAAKLMGTLGIQYQTADGRMLPFRQSIRNFHDALMKLAPVQRQQALNTLFGSDAIRAANIIFGQGVQKFDSYKKATEQSGSAADLAAAKMKGFHGSVEAFKSALETVAITLGTMLLPGLTKAMTWLGSFAGKIDEFVSSHPKQFQAAFAAIGSVLTGFGDAVGWVAGLIRRHWDTISSVTATLVTAISAGVAKIRQAVGTAFTAVEQFTRQHWGQVKAVVLEVVGAIKALWDRFGPAITTIAKATWEAVKKVVEGTMRAIQGVINVIMGLIHGDWSRVWTGVKQIVGGIWTVIVALIKRQITVAWTVIKTAAGLFYAAATAVGQKILQGLRDILSYLVETISAPFKKAWSWLTGAAGTAFAKAFAIGSAIAQGIVNGIGDLASRLINKVKGPIDDAIGWIKGHLGIKSPSRVMAEEIGIPMADGISMGFVSRAGAMAMAFATALDKAVTVAVEKAKAMAMPAIDALTSMVSQAISGVIGAKQTKSEIKLQGQTPSEQKLGAMQAQDEEIARARQLADAKEAVAKANADAKAAQEAYNQSVVAAIQAQQAYDAALASGSQEQIDSTKTALDAAQKAADDQYNTLLKAKDDQISANQSLYDTQRQMQEQALQAKAEAERKALEAKAAAERKQMDSANTETMRQVDLAIAELQRKLEAGQITTGQYVDGLSKLLKKYDVNFQSAGAALGTAFAVGLQNQAAAAAAAAQAIMNAALSVLGGSASSGAAGSSSGGGKGRGALRVGGSASRGGGQTINLMLDGKTVAEVVVSHGNARVRRGGAILRAGAVAT